MMSSFLRRKDAPYGDQERDVAFPNQRLTDQYLLQGVPLLKKPDRNSEVLLSIDERYHPSISILGLYDQWYHVAIGNEYFGYIPQDCFTEANG